MIRGPSCVCVCISFIIQFLSIYYSDIFLTYCLSNRSVMKAQNGHFLFKLRRKTPYFLFWRRKMALRKFEGLEFEVMKRDHVSLLYSIVDQDMAPLGTHTSYNFVYLSKWRIIQEAHFYLFPCFCLTCEKIVLDRIENRTVGEFVRIWQSGLNNCVHNSNEVLPFSISLFSFDIFFLYIFKHIAVKELTLIRK